MRRLGSHLGYSDGVPGLMKENESPISYNMSEAGVSPGELGIPIYQPEIIDLVEVEEYIKKGRDYKLLKVPKSSDSGQDDQFVVLLDEFRHDIVIPTPEPLPYPSSPFSSPFHFSPMSPGALNYKPSTPSTLPCIGESVTKILGELRPVILFDKRGLIRGWIHKDHRVFNSVEGEDLPDTVFVRRDAPTNNIKIEKHQYDMRVYTKKGHIRSGPYNLQFEVMTRVASFCKQPKRNEKAVFALTQIFMNLDNENDFFLGAGWTCRAFSLPKIGDVKYEQSIRFLEENSDLSRDEIVETLDGYVIKPYANDRIVDIYKPDHQRFQVNQSGLYKELHENMGLKLVEYESFIVPVVQKDGKKTYVMADRQKRVEESQFLHKIIEGELEEGNVDYIVNVFYKILDEVVGSMFWVNHYIPDLEISVDTNTKNFVLGEDGYLYLTDLSPPAAIWRGRNFTAYNFLNGEDNNEAWKRMFKLLCKPVFQFCYPLVKMWIHGPALRWFFEEKVLAVTDDFAVDAFREYMNDENRYLALSSYFRQISGVIDMAAGAENNRLEWFENVLNDLSINLDNQGFNWSDGSNENIEHLISFLESYRPPRSLKGLRTTSFDKKKQLLRLVVLAGTRLVTDMRLKEKSPPHPFCPQEEVRCKAAIEAIDEAMDVQETMDVDELMIAVNPELHPLPKMCQVSRVLTADQGAVSPALSVLDVKPFKDPPSSVLALSANYMECSGVPTEESPLGMNSPCEVCPTKTSSSEKVSVEESLVSSMDISGHYGVVGESIHIQREGGEQNYLKRVDVKKERSTPSPEACRKLSFSDASEYGVELKPAIIKRDSAKRKLQKYIDYTQTWLMAENGGRGLKLELRRQGIRAPEIPGNLAVIIPRGCFNKHPDAFRDTLDRVGDEFLVKNSSAYGCQYKLCQDNRDDVAVSNWDFIVQNTSCANVKAFFGDKKLVSNLVRVCLPKISSVMRDAVCMTALATSRDVGLDYELDAVVLIDLKGYPYYENALYTLYLQGKIYKDLTQKDITNFIADHSINESGFFNGNVKVFIGLFVWDDKDLEGNAADMYFQTQECSAGACNSRVLSAEDLFVRDISLRDDSRCDDSMMEGLDVIDDIKPVFEHQRRVNTSTDSGIVSGYSTSPEELNIASFLNLDKASLEEVEMIDEADMLKEVFQDGVYSQSFCSPHKLRVPVSDINLQNATEIRELIDKVGKFDHIQMLNFVCHNPFFIAVSMDILSRYPETFGLPRFLAKDFYTDYKIQEQYMRVCGLTKEEARAFYLTEEEAARAGCVCGLTKEKLKPVVLKNLYKTQKERRAFVIGVLACLLERDTDYSRKIKYELKSRSLANELNCVFREATGHFLHLDNKNWHLLLFSDRTPHYFFHNDETAQPIVRVFSRIEKARAIISAISKRYGNGLEKEHDFYHMMAWSLNESMEGYRGSRIIRDTMDLSLLIAGYWLQNKQRLININQFFKDDLSCESQYGGDIANVYRKIFTQFWIEPLRSVIPGG